MIEQFDKELRDHIKDTFDVYNDLMEDDGWLKYERKVKRKKYRAIFWWSFPGSIAAALALVWLLNIVTFDTTGNKTEITAHKPANPIDNNQSKTIETEIKKENKTSIEKQPKEQFYLVDNNKTSEINNVVKNTNKIIEKPNKSISDSELLVNSENIIVENKTGIPLSDIEQAEIKAENKITISPQQETLANSINEVKTSFKEDKGFNNNFSDLANNAGIGNTGEEKKDKLNSKKFKVDIDASTFMNFTKDGMSQDMNLGVGLASELKISKNFSINSGININKQSASYTANSGDGDVRESFKNAAAFSGLTAMAAPVVNQESLSAKLVGFDIPFAIKYSSNNKNLNWFLSTGFSSYTLLTETYFNNISIVNYGFNGIQTTNEVRKEEHKDGLFSNLQLARTLNFSVGLQFPIKNVTSLSVEPFIKYPLRSFGREDLTIGSSGVSLKMNLDKRLFK